MMRKFPKKVSRKIQKLLNPLDWKIQKFQKNRASPPRDCSLLRKFGRSFISQWKFPKVKLGTFGREENVPCSNTSKNHKLKERKTKVKERFPLARKTWWEFSAKWTEQVYKKQNKTGRVSTTWQYSRTFKLKGLFHYIPHRYNHVFPQEAQE